ncbi:MAG TPA: hypothetical protein VFW40_10005 [Capsulimonadaceae bacterium]|nr:hypothetical protein [Capsulimonadaceae bacterium]
MIIQAAVVIPLETKNPSEAIQEANRLFGAYADESPRPRITLDCRATSNFAILRSIAQNLPGHAMSFRFFKLGRNQEFLSAKEFLERLASIEVVRVSKNDDAQAVLSKFLDANSARTATFQGTLTDYLPFDQALELVHRIARHQPGAIRSTSLSVHFDDFTWRVLPEEGLGSVFLQDSKAWRSSRKHRFEIVVQFQWRGKGEADPAFRKLLQQLAAKTGLPFEKAGIMTLPDPSNLASDDVGHDDLFIADLLYKTAIKKAKAEIQAAYTVRHLLAASALDTEPLNPRYEKAPSSDYNPRTDIKKWIGETLPDFAARKAKRPRESHEIYRFDQSVTDKLCVFVSFDRPPGLNSDKTLTISLGVEMTSGRLEKATWRVNLFELNGYPFPHPSTLLDHPTTFPEKVAPIGPLLRLSADKFQDAVITNMAEIPCTMPQSMERRGPLTAKKAMHYAALEVQLWAEDAQLFGVRSESAAELHYGTGLGVNPEPLLTFDGTLTEYGQWKFLYYSPAKNEELHIAVPALGPISYTKVRLGDPPQQFLEKDWIDSDRALALAEANGGKDARQGFEQTFGFQASIDSDPWRQPSHLWWQVRYPLHNARGYKEFIILIDAETGGEIRIVQS